MPKPDVQQVGLAKAELVARALERDIRDGRAPHGAPLASETALTHRFAVSRNTVRRGLKLLAQQGLITTRMGIGSFVTCDGVMIDGAQGWTVALSRGSGAVTTRVLGLRRGGCAKADAFLGAQGEYLCVDRLRQCGVTGQGITLERSRLPWRADFRQLLAEGLVGGSISATVAFFGLIPCSGREVAGVLPALSAEDAGLLGWAVGAPMLRLERLVRDAEGRPIEYVESLLDPARFGLRVDF